MVDMRLVEDIVRRRDRLTLDHPMDPGWTVAVVQFQQAVGDIRIGLGAALVVADIIDPGRHVIGFRPDVRIFQIAHQRPIAGTIAQANAAALDHDPQELRNVFVGNLEIDMNDDRAAAATEVELQGRLVEAVQRIEIKGGKAGMGRKKPMKTPTIISRLDATSAWPDP